MEKEKAQIPSHVIFPCCNLKVIFHQKFVKSHSTESVTIVMFRLDEFMAGFNAISLKLKEMYQVCLDTIH